MCPLFPGVFMSLERGDNFWDSHPAVYFFSFLRIFGCEVGNTFWRKPGGLSGLLRAEAGRCERRSALDPGGAGHGLLGDESPRQSVWIIHVEFGGPKKQDRFVACQSKWELDTYPGGRIVGPTPYMELR